MDKLIQQEINKQSTLPDVAEFQSSWERTLLLKTATVMDAVRVINETSMKTALIVDDSQRLLGIVTDGDIRRALLNGRAMQDLVSEVWNQNPITANRRQSKKARLKIMREGQLISLPVVDDDNRVVGLELFSTITVDKRENPVFLMAGGFGTRLKPLTDNCPKPLLNVGGKPILEHIISAFSEYGFSNIHISVHYMEQKIREYFGDGSRWGINITYHSEDRPLGTAGALGALPNQEKELPLIMMNADLLTNVNFENLLDFHVDSKSMVTVGVREYDFQVPYGVLNHSKGIVRDVVEKPVHQFFVNAGIYVLQPEIYSNISKGVYLDMPNLLNKLIADTHKVVMFPIHEYWLDIGKLNDFERAQEEYGKLFQ